MGYLFGVRTLAGKYMTSGLTQLKEEGAKSVVIAHDSKTFSEAACAGAKRRAETLGYMVLKVDEYKAGDLDFAPIIKGWMQLGSVPDVVVGCGHFDDAVLVLATSKIQNFNPKAFLI